MKICGRCRINKEDTEFYKSTSRGLQSYCKDCHKTRPSRGNYWKNREYNVEFRTRNKEKSKEWHLNLKKDVIRAYGGKCECCNESNIEFLSIDHINGGGNLKRKSGEHYGGSMMYRNLKKLDFPKGEFRVLCHNCNQALGHYGYCPHQNKS